MELTEVYFKLHIRMELMDAVLWYVQVRFRNEVDNCCGVRLRTGLNKWVS